MNQQQQDVKLYVFVVRFMTFTAYLAIAYIFLITEKPFTSPVLLILFLWAIGNGYISWVFWFRDRDDDCPYGIRSIYEGRIVVTLFGVWSGICFLTYALN